MTCFAARPNATIVIATVDRAKTRFSLISRRAISERPPIPDCLTMQKASRIGSAILPTRAARRLSIRALAASSQMPSAQRTFGR